MADQYDQTVSFTDLPLSIQRNIQDEIRNDVEAEFRNEIKNNFKKRSFSQGASNQKVSAKNNRKNNLRSARYTSSPLRKSQSKTNMTPFSNSKYATIQQNTSSYASKRMLDMMVDTNISESKTTKETTHSEGTGLSPILRNSPVVSYALNRSTPEAASFKKRCCK